MFTSSITKLLTGSTNLTDLQSSTKRWESFFCLESQNSFFFFFFFRQVSRFFSVRLYLSHFVFDLLSVFSSLANWCFLCLFWFTIFTACIHIFVCFFTYHATLYRYFFPFISSSSHSFLPLLPSTCIIFWSYNDKGLIWFPGALHFTEWDSIY